MNRGACVIQHPANLRERAEAAVAEEIPDFERMSPKAIRSLFQDLRVSYAELGLRNEILRQACEEHSQKADETLALLACSPDGIVRFDRDMRIQYANPAFERVFGLPAEKITGHNLHEFEIPESKVDLWESNIRSVFETSQEANMEFEYAGKEGRRYYHIRSVAERSENGDGGVASVIVTAHDVTELVLAREKLREDEEKFRVIAELISNYAYSFRVESDSRLTIEWVIGAFEYITGYTPEEANVEGDFIAITHPDDKEENRRRLETLLSGHEERARLRYISKNGDVHWMQDNARPVCDENGRIVRIIGAVAEISDLKHAEEMAWRLTVDEERLSALNESLRRKTVQLQATNKELESFSYSISHDLRAPLRSMDGFSLALLEDYSDRLDDEGRDYLNRIRAASQRMARLIDDILQLSRTTRAEIHYTTVNLSVQAESIIEELRHADPERKVETMIHKGITLEGDEILLRQTLENLIGNAWKFTSHITDARIEFGEKQENGRRILFVRDNGAGFDRHYTENLFTPFRRLHSDTEFSGTGIGLSIVKRIIDRHGGEIWAEGEPGNGATFYFTLGE